MKNRREFIHLTSLGLLSPLMYSPLLPSLEETDNTKGVVCQPEDGKTFIVRENTPIKIQVSKKRDSAETISICTEEIQPGNQIPIHKHPYADEFFIFLAGNGTIEIDGVEFPVKPGKSGFVPRATWHSIQNNNSGILAFSFGYSPSGFEDFFRQIGTPKGTPFKAKPREELLMIAEKYGMIFK